MEFSLSLVEVSAPMRLLRVLGLHFKVGVFGGCMFRVKGCSCVGSWLGRKPLLAF